MVLSRGTIGIFIIICLSYRGVILGLNTEINKRKKKKVMSYKSVLSLSGQLFVDAYTQFVSLSVSPCSLRSARTGVMNPFDQTEPRSPRTETPWCWCVPLRD